MRADVNGTAMTKITKNNSKNLMVLLFEILVSTKIKQKTDKTLLSVLKLTFLVLIAAKNPRK